MSSVRRLTFLSLLFSCGTAAALPWPRPTVEQWADALVKSPDVEVRARAAQALGRLGPTAKDAVPALAAALEDESPYVEMLATEAIGRIGPPAGPAVPQLVRGLRPERKLDPAIRVGMRQATKDALVGIGEPAVPVVTEMLSSESVINQMTAAEILARIGRAARTARPALEQAFQSSKNPVVRAWAAAALVRVGADNKAPLEFLRQTLSGRGEIGLEAGAALGTIGPAATPILLDALTGKDRAAAGAADAGLRRLGPAVLEPMTKLLAGDDRHRRRLAVGVLGGLEPADLAKAIPVLVTELRRADDETWEDTAKALSHAGAAAVPPLLDVVRQERGKARLVAVFAISRLEGEELDPATIREIVRTMIPALIGELGFKDDEWREGVVHALGGFGPEAASAVPALLKAAASDPSPGVRGQALIALGRTGVRSDEVVRAVVAGLADKEGHVRHGAMRACAGLGPAAKDAVPRLIELVGADVGESPEPAVFALGRIGPAAKAAAPKLLELLKEEDVERASHAAIALLRIGVEQKAAVAVLTKAVREAEPHIRHRTLGALRGLGGVGRPLVPLLKVVAADPDAPASLRNEADRLLGEIDRPKGDARPKE